MSDSSPRSTVKASKPIAAVDHDLSARPEITSSHTSKCTIRAVLGLYISTSSVETEVQYRTIAGCLKITRLIVFQSRRERPNTWNVANPVPVLSETVTVVPRSLTFLHHTHNSRVCSAPLS